MKICDILNPSFQGIAGDICYISATDKHFQNCMYLQRIGNIGPPLKPEIPISYHKFENAIFGWLLPAVAGHGVAFLQ
jgi:hypothetical protein